MKKENKKIQNLPTEFVGNGSTTNLQQIANTAIGGKYNLAQFKPMKERMLQHKQVCAEVLAFAETHPTMPKYAIMWAGIGIGAVKKTEFSKGYTKFDRERAEFVFNAATYMASKLGDKKPSDTVYQIAIKYHDKVSTNIDDFKSAIDANVESLTSKRGHNEEMRKILKIA